MESITELEPLRGQHIWRDEVIQSRFEWGGEHAIFAIALRVWKLPQSIEIPVREDYGGCKSWIELQMPLDLQGAVPVLSDTEFASRLRRFHESLPAPARNHPPLILASQSPRRVDLLREIEPDFGVVASLAVELHDATGPPRRLCEINAQRKALAVAERFPAHLILGADTLVFLDGKPLGKPADIEEARWMLQQLSGRIHEVITGLCLIQHESNRILLFSEVSRVRFKSLTPPVIDEYLSRVFVFDKAGGYAIQEYGEWIVESVEGSYSNIVGLPQEALRAALSTWNRKANSQ